MTLFSSPEDSTTAHFLAFLGPLLSPILTAGMPLLAHPPLSLHTVLQRVVSWAMMVSANTSAPVTSKSTSVFPSNTKGMQKLKSGMVGDCYHRDPFQE